MVNKQKNAGNLKKSKQVDSSYLLPQLLLLQDVVSGTGRGVRAA